MIKKYKQVFKEIFIFRIFIVLLKNNNKHKKI